MAREDISGRIISAISGETILIAGGVSVSGNIVQISGQHVFVESGVLVVIQSGAGVTITQTTPTLVQTGAILAVTGTSGGVAISSGVVVSAVVKAIAGNSGDIYVGGSGATRNPYSGYGYLLRPGEAYGTDINNLYSVNVVASSSGDKITFIGVG